MVYGVLFVMTHGIFTTLELPAENLDYQVHVSNKEPLEIHVLILYVDPKALPGFTYYGDGPKLLGGLLCNGDEESLLDCPRGSAGNYYCSSYSEIASIVCSNGE